MQIVATEQDIVQAAAAHSLTPLWTIYGDIMAHEPAPACQAAHWRYAEVRPLLKRAGEEVSTEVAERRVLLFHNPGLPAPFTTHTMGCGLQLLRAGERERAHRHTAAALRFVLEGQGAYTTTDGERIWMRPGDLILTPGWCWHEHGNMADSDVIWLDGIDLPIVSRFAVGFTEYEPHAPGQPTMAPDGESHWLYGSGLAPLEAVRHKPYSPVFSYPYERSREVLENLRQAQRLDPCHGLKLRYANPQDGGDIMPTVAAFIQLLPAGFRTAPYRSTDAAVFCVAEGSGRVFVGDHCFELAKHDVFVAPNWTDYRFEAGEDVVLFSFSDRAAQERLAIWRERRAEGGPSENTQV